VRQRYLANAAPIPELAPVIITVLSWQDHFLRNSFFNINIEPKTIDTPTSGLRAWKSAIERRSACFAVPNQNTGKSRRFGENVKNLEINHDEICK
jgi:hypothetical protein